MENLRIETLINNYNKALSQQKKKGKSNHLIVNPKKDSLFSTSMLS